MGWPQQWRLERSDLPAWFRNAGWLKNNTWAESATARIAGTGLAVVLIVLFFVWLLGLEGTKGPGPVPLGPEGISHSTELAVPGEVEHDAALRNQGQSVSVTEPQGPRARIFGSVANRRRLPLAAATVRVTLERAGRRSALGTSVCDKEGLYTLELPALEDLSPAELGLCSLWVEAFAPGYRVATERLPLNTEDLPELELTLLLDAGATLFGVVVDRHGRGIAGAEVALSVADRRGREALWRTSAQVSSGPGGHFALGFTSSGEYRITARHDAHGRVAREIELDPFQPNELDELVLRGTGVLAGSVSYPDGSPVRELEIVAVAEAFAEHALGARLERTLRSQEGSLDNSRGSREDTREDADGLILARTSTDDEGRFRFTALRPGAYVLRYAALQKHSPATVFRTGEEGLALVLRAHRLLVATRDSRGRALAGARISCFDMPTSANPEGGASLAGGRRVGPTRGRRGRMSFAVAPGSTYALHARAPGCQPAEARVQIARGSYETEIGLELRPEGERARLALWVYGSGGRRLENLRIKLRSPVTGRYVDGLTALVPDANGWLPPLPAGRYLMEILPYGPDGGASDHFPIEGERIELAPGEERTLELSARAGVRLSLNLSAALLPPGLELQPDPELSERELLSWQENLRRRHGARIVAVGPYGARTRRLAFHDSISSPLLDLVLPGESVLCEPLLEAGDYLIEVNAPGFRKLTRSLSLGMGASTELTLELEPR